MTWQPGQSGNPKGRPPRGETIADALREALTPEAKRAIAERVVSMAMAGDLAAVSFLATRLDGPPRHDEADAGVLVAVQVHLDAARDADLLAGPTIEA